MKYIVFTVVSIVILASCGNKEEKDKHYCPNEFPKIRERGNGLNNYVGTGDTLFIETTFYHSRKYDGFKEIISVFSINGQLFSDYTVLDYFFITEGERYFNFQRRWKFVF